MSRISTVAAKDVMTTAVGCSWDDDGGGSGWGECWWAQGGFMVADALSSPPIDSATSRGQTIFLLLVWRDSTLHLHKFGIVTRHNFMREVYDTTCHQLTSFYHLRARSVQCCVVQRVVSGWVCRVSCVESWLLMRNDRAHQAFSLVPIYPLRFGLS